MRAEEEAARRATPGESAPQASEPEKYEFAAKVTGPHPIQGVRPGDTGEFVYTLDQFHALVQARALERVEEEQDSVSPEAGIAESAAVAVAEGE